MSGEWKPIKIDNYGIGKEIHLYRERDDGTREYMGEVFESIEVAQKCADTLNKMNWR